MTIISFYPIEHKRVQNINFSKTIDDFADIILRNKSMFVISQFVRGLFIL